MKVITKNIKDTYTYKTTSLTPQATLTTNDGIGYSVCLPTSQQNTRIDADSRITLGTR